MSQEFRDRCALAMGWVVRDDRYRGSVRVWQWTTGEDDVRGFWYDEWKPDEDYNQAMMMRDSLKDGWYTEFYLVLVNGKFSDEGPWGEPNWGHVEDAAHATALEIATAALSVLEKRQSTNDDEATQPGASRSEAEQPTKDGGE